VTIGSLVDFRTLLGLFRLATPNIARMPRLRLRPRLLLLIASATFGPLCMGAVPAGAAGTATLEGTTVSYTDSVGASDELSVSISNEELATDAEELGGWRVGFLQYNPATTIGPGCRQGFVSTICPTGAVAPAASIDLGVGNDQVRVETTPSIPGQQATIAGGPGDDLVQAYQTNGVIDGGSGNDRFEVDRRYSINQFPPEITPGGVLRGGDGTDTVDYTLALQDVDVSLDGKANDGRQGEGDNVMPDVENVVGAAFGSALIGSNGPNELTGGLGDDQLVGAAGQDRLDGSSGNDTIDALDGTGGDRVTCGDGADVAFVDAGDLVTSEDVAGGTPCEKVVYAPAVPSSLRWKSKRIAVSASCPKLSTATCSGTLRLTSNAGKKLASVSYRVKPGKKVTLRLRPARKPSRKAVLVVAPKGSAPMTGRAVSIR
jgi:hypothetical protein